MNKTSVSIQDAFDVLSEKVADLEKKLGELDRKTFVDGVVTSYLLLTIKKMDADIFLHLVEALENQVERFDESIEATFKTALEETHSRASAEKAAGFAREYKERLCDILKTISGDNTPPSFTLIDGGKD